MRNHIRRITASAIGLLLLVGIGRAATSHCEEQLKAFLASCVAEQKRLGLAGNAKKKELFGKYPSPEITLARTARAVPGGAGELIVKGKFAPGTKFFLDNCSVEVTSESLKGDTYRATFQISKLAGPGVAGLHALAAVSGGKASAQPVVWIGGKYEWQLTASNGMRIKMTQLDEGGTAEQTRAFVAEEFPGDQLHEVPASLYRAEFYRGSEARPFRTREVSLRFDRGTGAPSYSGGINLTRDEMEKQVAAGAASAGEDAAAQQAMDKWAAEIAEIIGKLGDPNLSESARNKLMAQMDKLQAGGPPKTSAQKQEEKEQSEFGCKSISFQALQGTVTEGSIQCGEAQSGNTISLPLKGTMKFVAP